MNKVPYSFNDKYILRTPALSILEIEKITSSQKLKDLLSNPFISESIYLTSPELYDEIQKYFEKGQPFGNKIERTLVKFILRMCFRCIPFGLFAGISMGSIKNKGTKIELDSIDKYQRKTRLDMNYLCSLSQKLEADKETKNSLLYYPNSSIYKIGEEYRYIEYKYVDTVRNHYMISIDASEHIEKILSLSVDGAKIKDLAKAIISNQISFEEAENFIINLIDNQILISSISPSVTGNSYLDSISNRTNISWLRDLNKLVEELDGKLTNKDLKQYKIIIKTLENHKIPFNKKFLFQTDLIVATKYNLLEDEVTEDIKKSLVVLNKLKRIEENPILRGFKKAFYERYEEEEISLCLALDVETGIGYDQSLKNSYDVCPLVDDLITINDDFNTTTSDNLENNFFLYKKLEEAQNKNSFEITIDDNDVKDLNLNWDDLPQTFPIIASIFKDKNLNHIVSFDHIGGATSNFLIGRFGHVKREFENLLKEITSKEDNNENTIFAEIVHLPESRTGNILYRPKLRDFEIPYLAKSCLPVKNQIAITDIYISIVNDKIILRSKKLNKFIEPRMANAHAYWGENTLPIYHFLCDMQSQSKRRYLDFDWSKHVKNNRFLPRVRYKNTILSRARWCFIELKITDFNTLTNWKINNNIPDSFFLLDNNNELFIDLNIKRCCEIFIKEIKSKPVITIIESLSNEFTSVVKHNNDEYANEFMFFLKKNDSNGE